MRLDEFISLVYKDGGALRNSTERLKDGVVGVYFARELSRLYQYVWEKGPGKHGALLARTGGWCVLLELYYKVYDSRLKSWAYKSRTGTKIRHPWCLVSSGLGVLRVSFVHYCGRP